MTEAVFNEKKSRIQGLENGRGLRYILDAGFEILGNPIMMFDTSYTLLLSNDVVTDDWVWNEIATLGTFSQETVDFFNREHFIEAFAVSETVAFMKSEGLKYERANGKLFDTDNVQLGNISVVACFKPFEEGDMQLIELFCEVLSIGLQNSEIYQNINRVYQETLIDRIISGDPMKHELNNDVLADLYSGLKANLYLAVVDITQYDPTNTHLAYFRDLFKKAQKEYRYYVHLNNVVILISTDNEILRVKNELAELCAFFEKYDIYAGVSGKFQNILESSKYFREAIAALNYGIDSGRTQNIFCYDEFRVEHFLYSAASDTDQICNPAVTLIYKSDRALFDVLYTHLLYGLNPAISCEKIGITPEALSSKLRILEDVFGIDWTNGNMLLNIFLSTKFVNK